MQQCADKRENFLVISPSDMLSVILRMCRMDCCELIEKLFSKITIRSTSVSIVRSSRSGNGVIIS